MHRLRLVGVVTAGLAAAFCLPATAGAQSGAATTRAVDAAVSALGGESALTGLRTFRLQATGRAFIFDEGPQPNDDVTPASTFTTTVTYERRGSGDRWRADSVRTSLGTARSISEVIAGRRGYLNGVDVNNGQPATTAMTSDRWAAIIRE